MATEPTTPEGSEVSDVSEQEGTIAQQPRLVSRLRLVPLGVLFLMVTAAAVVGVVHGGRVTAGLPASALPKDPAVKAAERAEKAKSRCAPTYSTGVKSEPWQGAQRKVSEKAFNKGIKGHRNYVPGKDGWIFFSDNQSLDISQAVGRVTQSTKQREAWARWIAKEEQIVKKGGGHYYVVVAPAKWDIYPQKLPSWAQKLRGTTSLRALMKAHPELPWIDPSFALRQAAKKNDTYERLNSHWTPYGGYVAWQAITRCLRAIDKGWAGVDVPAISGVGITTNLNEFAAYGVPDGTPQRTYPIWAQPHPPTTTTHEPDGATIATSPDFATDTLQAPLKTSTPGAARADLTMLTLRDSTGNAVSPFYSNSFGTTVQYGHGIGQVGLKPPNLSELMATYHPQLVLFVITERFLAESAPK
jgi:hypothetical protein